MLTPAASPYHHHSHHQQHHQGQAFLPPSPTFYPMPPCSGMGPLTGMYPPPSPSMALFPKMGIFSPTHPVTPAISNDININKDSQLYQQQQQQQQPIFFYSENGGKVSSSPQDSTMSLKFLMTAREVGSIIGKRGDNIKRIREESAARINISDGNTPERIVTIAGTCEQISTAGELICKKIENDFFSKPVVVAAASTGSHGVGESQPFSTPVGSSSSSLVSSASSLPEPVMTSHAVNTSSAVVVQSSGQGAQLMIRLLLPITQYLTILGDGVAGSIKRLKESTKAAILVGVDIYNNSVEKLLTLTGQGESVARGLADICNLLLDIQENTQNFAYPSKSINMTTDIPNSTGSMLSSQMGEGVSFPTSGFSLLPIQSIFSSAIYPSDPMTYMLPPGTAPPNVPLPLIPFKLPAAPVPIATGVPYQHHSNPGGDLQLASLPFPGAMKLNGGPPNGMMCSPLPQPPLQQLHQHQEHQEQQHSHHQQLQHSNGPVVNSNGGAGTVCREFFLHNDMIGCIIGRGGATINEIRSVSEAQIKIANCEDGKPERRISISGSLESVHMAQLLINSSIETFKQSVQLRAQQQQQQQQSPQPSRSQIPAQILSSLGPGFLSSFLAAPQSLNLTQNIVHMPSLNHTVSIVNNHHHDDEPVPEDELQLPDKSCLKMRPLQTNLDGSAKCNLDIKYRPY